MPQFAYVYEEKGVLCMAFPKQAAPNSRHSVRGGAAEMITLPRGALTIFLPRAPCLAELEVEELKG